MPTIFKRRIRVRATLAPNGDLVGARTVKTYRKRKSSKFATAVRKIAKAVVHREAENKYVSYHNEQNFNGTVSSSSECYPLMPPVDQGTDDFQRIGDKIRPKYLLVKGFVQLNPNAGQVKYMPPSTVRVMLLSQKFVKFSGDVSSKVDVAHLLKDNVSTGTGRPYSGTIFDNLAPINRDIFTVHLDRKMKFNWMSQQTQDSGGNPSVGWQTGNDRTKYFTCKIKLPKTLTFDDGTGSYPNNAAPFLCFGAVNDDGATPWTLTAPYQVSWMATLYYEDA